MSKAVNVAVADTAAVSSIYKDHTGQVAAPEAVSSQPLMAHNALVMTYADGFQNYLGAFDKWGEWASEMENQNGSSQLVRRTEFNFANKCQQAWIALYGNRSAEELAKGEGGDRRTVRFCARENVHYWETQWFGSVTENVADAGQHMQVVDTETGEVTEGVSNVTYANGLCNEPDGQWGPSPKKRNAAVRYEEAKLNFNMCKAEFDMYNEMYGLITGQAYVYKPYDESRSRLEVAPTQKGANLAARALANLTKPTDKVWPIVKKA